MILFELSFFIPILLVESFEYENLNFNDFLELF